MSGFSRKKKQTKNIDVSIIKAMIEEWTNLKNKHEEVRHDVTEILIL